MSKQLTNEQMLGFRDVPLSYQDDDQDIPLTVRKLFLLACNTYEGESMKDWKIVADIMDSLDDQEKEDKENVTLDDAWYEMIRPHMDTILPKAYRIHSPFMSEQLDKLANIKK
tara:strand:- start:204 stop:542 length:339 start_codon:yes stop_codon:yes gene_type:complete